MDFQSDFVQFTLSSKPKLSLQSVNLRLDDRISSASLCLILKGDLCSWPAVLSNGLSRKLQVLSKLSEPLPEAIQYSIGTTQRTQHTSPYITWQTIPGTEMSISEYQSAPTQPVSKGVCHFNLKLSLPILLCLLVCCMSSTKGSLIVGAFPRVNSNGSINDWCGVQFSDRLR